MNKHKELIGRDYLLYSLLWENVPSSLKHSRSTEELWDDLVSIHNEVRMISVSLATLLEDFYE
jgi:hypothetical protein